MKKESEFIREKVDSVLQNFVDEYCLHYNSDGTVYLIYPFVSFHDLWENCVAESMYVDDNISLEHDLTHEQLEILMDDLYNDANNFYHNVKNKRKLYDLYNLD